MSSTDITLGVLIVVCIVFGGFVVFFVMSVMNIPEKPNMSVKISVGGVILVCLYIIATLCENLSKML